MHLWPKLLTSCWDNLTILSANKYSATAQCVHMKEQTWTSCLTSYQNLMVQIEKTKSLCDKNPTSPKISWRKVLIALGQAMLY